MKSVFIIFIIIPLLFLYNSCNSSPGRAGNTNADWPEEAIIDGEAAGGSAGRADISARGAVGGIEAAPLGPMFSGNGGSSIRLAVLVPETHGEVPDFLPILIQGLLNSNINKFSAIRLIDRQNLDRILAEQKLSVNSSFSDSDYIKLGNLTNSQYLLAGLIQKLPGNRYSLQLFISETSTGERKATFIKDGTLAQVMGIYINEATLSMLEKLGVTLTGSGRQTLLAGSTSTMQAEASTARGIIAQAGGSEVSALLNYAQAVTFNPSQMEAVNFLNSLKSNISGGTISERILDDIQARAGWIDAFREVNSFFNEHPPFEITFDPNLIQVGETNWKKLTATLGMKIQLNSSDAGFNAINTLLEGLDKTGRRNGWGFNGWPLNDISPKTGRTKLFDGKRSFKYKVDAVLLNENGKTLGKSNINFTTNKIRFRDGDSVIQQPPKINEMIIFPDIKTDDLTPSLTIIITSVNGIPSADLLTSGYMKIETGSLESAITQTQKKNEVAKDDATKNYLGIMMTADTGKEKLRGYAWGGGFSVSPAPYIYLGADLRWGLANIKKVEEEDDDTDNPEKMIFTFCPGFGFVYPFNEMVKFYSDITLDIGNLGYQNGLLASWLTPAINAGLVMKISPYTYVLCYRLAFYKDNLVNSFGLGIGLGG